LNSCLEWHRYDEYDGPTYLGIRHKIRVRGWINPQAIAYTPILATDPPAVAITPGTPPSVTDFYIRDLLAMPQRQLICISGGQLVLVSPQPVAQAPPPPPPQPPIEQPPVLKANYPDPAPFEPPPPAPLQGSNFGSIAVDADLGPIPIVHSVGMNLGNKTWWVIFEISTLVNVCGTNQPPADVINSHRWTMTHDLDTEGLCSRTISGHAYFRTDRLFAKNQDAQALLGIPIPTIVPDQFRGWLFHPPFPNSRREIIRCEPNADGDEITYTIRDVELPINLYAKGATRVEVQHWAETDYAGAEGALDRLIHTDWTHISLSTGLDIATVTGAFGQFLPNDSNANGGTFLENQLQGAKNFIIDKTRALTNVLRYNPNNVPVVVIGCSVRVWGNRNTTRYNLQSIAWQIGMARLNLSLNGLSFDFAGGSTAGAAKILGGKQVRIEHDAAGKYVQISMQIRSQFLGVRIVSQLAPAPGVGALTMPDLNGAFPFQQTLPPGQAFGPLQGTPANPDPTSDETQTENISGGNQNLNTLNIGPQQGAGFLSDGQSRGAYLGLAVSQQLLAPCADSPEPIDPPSIDTTGADNTNPFKSWSPP
jgi:hypothetical protein